MVKNKSSNVNIASTLNVTIVLSETKIKYLIVKLLYYIDDEFTNRENNTIV